MKRLHYILGKIANKFGYTIQRSYRRPVVTLNVLFIAYAAMAHRRGKVRVLQVGAFDGEHADPIRQCIQAFPEVTEAILLEPQPGPAATLERRWQGFPAVSVKRAAIAGSEGAVTLWVPGSADGGSPWASIDSGHRRQFGLGARDASAIEVQGTTVGSVLEEHGWDDCDVLQIDAEGMDCFVLRQAFESGCRPAIIQIESAHLSRSERETTREIFKGYGYEIADLGRDTLAVKVERLVDGGDARVAACNTV